jgi:hypothetical protein
METNRAAMRRASKNHLVLCETHLLVRQAIDEYQVSFIATTGSRGALRCALRQSTALQQRTPPRLMNTPCPPGCVVARSRRRPTIGAEPTSFASELARRFFYFYDVGCRIAISGISFRYSLRIIDFANLICIIFCVIRIASLLAVFP